ncbi:hypothetical protein SEVIR_3G360201v4 [Setaria viridis]
MLHSTGGSWGAFATSPTRGWTWHSPSATSVGSCSDRRRSTCRPSRGSFAMLRGLSTMASTTRGVPGRHTSSVTVTATTPETSTPARARAACSSALASASSADSRSSSKWWPYPVVWLSTLLLLPLRLRLSSSLGFSAIAFVRMLKQWSSG